MSEAEALDAEHQEHLLSAERARHRLARDIQQIERIGGRLLRSGGHKLRVGLVSIALLGGLLVGLVALTALGRKR